MAGFNFLEKLGNKLLAMFVIEILFCYARHLCRVFNNFKNHNY
ncbi:hypothetical protein [Citrobacter freundii]|uniref:Uncharacterized protein n=1 Tax=Citrobacter freundii TaxID=546 RepID=A0A7G2IHB9_CITFR|nr:hypothetical protein [Citrobacter freundii]